MIIGTRPEAIKMAPVLRECRRRSGQVEPIVCLTGQHREMLTQAAAYFGIRPDLDLQVMQSSHTLSALAARCLDGIDAAIVRYAPGCIVAQGDTTTVLAASLAAFHRGVPFIHIEAGLRTGNLRSPWPEEYNRRVAGLTAALHCAPTKRAAENLLAEGVSAETIHVTGNTVVDALLWTVERERRRAHLWRKEFDVLADRRVVLITGHRRESFGGRFEAICLAILSLADRFADTEFVYPVHLNPNVREPVQRLLSGRRNIHLIEPVTYPGFVWLMDRCTVILTDSGGVQEEAPSLRKPVLVMRDTTERPEAVAAGAAQLVGTSPTAIVEATTKLLCDPTEYASRQIHRNPYGDGGAARRIVGLLLSKAWDGKCGEPTAA